MIVQTNVWICDNPKCKHIESTSEDVSPYSDPVVTPPKGVSWSYEYMEVDGEYLHLCNTCFDEFLELKKSPAVKEESASKSNYFLDSGFWKGIKEGNK